MDDKKTHHESISTYDETKRFASKQGLFERIPILYKLLLLITSLTGAFLFLGIIIIIVFSRRIMDARSSKLLLGISIDLGVLIRNIQAERLSATRYVNQNYTDINHDYMDSIDNTDRSISSAYRSLYRYDIPDTRIIKFNMNLNDLYLLRNNTQNRLGLTFVSYQYGLRVNSLLTLLAYFPSRVKNSNLLHSYSIFNRMIEGEYNIQAPGISTGKELLTPSDRYRGYVKSTGVSNDNLANWREFTPIKIVNHYDALITPAITMSLYRMTEAALLKTDASIIQVKNITDFRINVNPANFTLQYWIGNYTLKFDGIASVSKEIESTIIQEANKELSLAIGWIIAIVIAILILIIVLSVKSGGIMYTIISPWKRMNLIQEITLNKYIPSNLLSILRVKDVSGIVPGKSQECNIIMIAIQIKENTNDDIISTLNKHIEYLGPDIDISRGFILSHDRDIVIICVSSMKKAMTLVKQLIHKPYNIAIHRTILSIGAVGHSTYIGFMMLGKESNVCRDLLKLASKTDSHLLVTDSIGKNISNIADMRKIGIFSSDTSIQVYEIKTPNMIDISNLNMKDQSSISDQYPNDKIIQLYHRRYRFLLDKHTIYCNQLHLSDILQHDTLRDQFIEYLQSTKIRDILSLYEGILLFKKIDDRSSQGKYIHSTYIDRDSSTCVILPQDFMDKLSMEESYTKIDTFNDIEKILESLLEGYIQLYKKSTKFSLPMSIETDLMSLI